MNDKILFVDDEADVLHELGFLLDQFKNQVTFALSARDAINRLKSENFKVVVCDYYLKGVRGDKILEFIKEQGLDCKFIYYTSEISQQVPTQPVYDALIHKDSSMDTLVSLLKSFIENR